MILEAVEPRSMLPASGGGFHAVFEWWMTKEQEMARASEQKRVPKLSFLPN
jgi:hypothetical protein